MPEDYQVTWSGPALNDLQRLKRFLEPKNRQAAVKAVTRIKRVVQALKINPLIGTNLDPGDPRRELYPRFGHGGYAVRYVVDENKHIVRILRIWHSREERN